MRCLALAKSLSINGLNCIFLINEDHGGSSDLISLEGFETYLISQIETTNRSIKAYVEHDLSSTINILRNYSSCFCLVVDHYDLDHTWEQSISKYVESIVVIDDLVNRKHYCDVIVDSSFKRETLEYKDLVPAKAKILTGSKYVLLRNEFIQARNLDTRFKILNYPPKRILVNFGGSASDKIYLKVLKQLEQSNLPNDVKVDIVLGPLNVKSEELLKAKLTSRLSVNTYVSVECMSKMILAADLCLGAVGSTTWERFCLRRPSILTVLAPNQLEGAKKLHSAGLVELFDPINDYNLISKIKEITEEKMVKMLLLAATLVDGLGCDRVTENILNMRRS